MKLPGKRILVVCYKLTGYFCQFNNKASANSAMLLSSMFGAKPDLEGKAFAEYFIFAVCKTEDMARELRDKAQALRPDCVAAMLETYWEE